MTVDKRDERIGIHGGKKATLNLAGQDFRRPATTLMGISGDMYVVMDGLPGSFDVAAALKDLGASAAVIADNTPPAPDKAVAPKPPVGMKTGGTASVEGDNG